MAWKDDIAAEVEALFAEQSVFVEPIGGFSHLPLDWKPLRVVDPIFVIRRGHYGCRKCGGPVARFGKWQHARCLACRPLKRIFDSESFPCGHPRTEENTQRFGVKNPSKRCKTCNRAAARAADRRRRAAAKEKS